MLTSFRCHDKPDVNVTLLMAIFILVCENRISISLFNVNGNVVNAQTWEVLTLKHPIKPPHGATNGVTTVKS